jgi:REase_AHJR-like
MTKDEILQRVVEKYKSEGYRVTIAAGTGVLPAEIHHLRDHIDLIAQKEGDFVVIEVKRRDQLYEINPLEMTIERDLPGFRYDLVVYPPDGIDGIPLEDGEPSSEYVESLLEEARQLLDFGKARAAFLIGWSAIETAMRTSCRCENLEIGDGSPHFVLKTLYSNGVISYEDYNRLRLCLDKRNRLVHGLSVDHLEPDDVRFMIEFARQLPCAAPADA